MVEQYKWIVLSAVLLTLENVSALKLDQLAGLSTTPSWPKPNTDAKQLTSVVRTEEKRPVTKVLTTTPCDSLGDQNVLKSGLKTWVSGVFDSLDQILEKFVKFTNNWTPESADKHDDNWVRTRRSDKGKDEDGTVRLSTHKRSSQPAVQSHSLRSDKSSAVASGDATPAASKSKRSTTDDWSHGWTMDYLVDAGDCTRRPDLFLVLYTLLFASYPIIVTILR